MSQPVRVKRIRAEMFQHAANQAFSGRNISREADHVFTFPATHGIPSKSTYGVFIDGSF